MKTTGETETEAWFNYDHNKELLFKSVIEQKLYSNDYYYQDIELFKSVTEQKLYSNDFYS